MVVMFTIIKKEFVHTPLISIIIPTYNRHDELIQLLTSLTRQTYKNFEVIIINDAPNCHHTILTFQNLSITWINNIKNTGGVRSRNKALHIARGQYIMPIDDDDLILSNHLELMVQHCLNADLLYCDAELVYEDRKNGRNILKRIPYNLDFDPLVQKKYLTVIPSGIFYKKILHDQLGFFDERFENCYWDWDWILRVMETHSIKRLPYATVLYFFDQGGNNNSFNHIQMTHELNLFSKKHQLDHLTTENFYTILHKPELNYLKKDTTLFWNGKL